MFHKFIILAAGGKEAKLVKMASHRLILAAAVLVCLAARGQGTSSVGSQGIRTLRERSAAGLSLYRTDAEGHTTLEEVAKQVLYRQFIECEYKVVDGKMT